MQDPALAEEEDTVTVAGPWIKKAVFKNMHFGQSQDGSFRASGRSEVSIVHNDQITTVAAHSSIEGKYDSKTQEIEAAFMLRYKYPLIPRKDGKKITFVRNDFSFFLRTTVISAAKAAKTE